MLLIGEEIYTEWSKINGSILEEEYKILDVVVDSSGLARKPVLGNITSGQADGLKRLVCL